MPTTQRRSRLSEGLPYPLGATWDGLGVNFALFSANATKVELCLFDETGQKQIECMELPEFTDEVWHGYVHAARPGTTYAYRVHGPYAPEQGHRFNHHKLLLDPYARAHVGELSWHPEIFGYTRGAADADLGFDTRDSAPYVPKCRVVDPAFTWGRAAKPRVPWERTILYETHVRGATKLHPALPESMRGTFAGLAMAEVVEHIRALGVTSVELLPVHTFVNDDFLLDRGLTNFWGYNTIGFFAPDPRYASQPGRVVAEFKEMVARLHDAGLEVILDVVYNHTAEGDERGPTLSFRGIDNASYYRLPADNPRAYVNDTGCGNTVNLRHPRVIQMVTDSLRYWASEMQVDGFRFDLGTILAREAHGFDEQSGFLKACGQDPVLSGVKLIAEPWDLGPGGYQVGGFPPGWAEWNDKYRDAVRSFWRGDIPPRELAPRLCASSDVFNRRGRKPWSSVNFVAAHDGFTLRDVVSYERKHNAANGERNRDGTDHNYSCNHGVEGPSSDAAIAALRARQMRNMLATLLLSQGTPMLLAGDEFGRTQVGNNNAYCQDNETSWVHWPRAGDEASATMVGFVRLLAALRHEHSILRRGRFMTGAWNAALAVRDASWIAPSGQQMKAADWDDPALRCFGMLMDGRAQATGIRRRGTAATMLLLFNAHHEDVRFILPACTGGTHWKLLFDTATPESVREVPYDIGNAYDVTERSCLLFRLNA